MLASSRWIGIACVLTLVATGCGGSSSSTPISGSDATADSSGMTQMDDGTVETDGATGPVDAYVGPVDATVETESGTTPEGGQTEGGTTPEAGVTDAGNGSACGANSECANGHCVGGICCASACTPGTCQKATCADGMTCAYPPASDGSSCNDNNACTTSDHCVSGQCTGGTAVSCDDGNPCTDDSCDMALGCKNQNNTAACNDNNACTVNDTCSGGLCSGSPMDCSGAAYNDACNVGVCSGGACAKSPKANTTSCDDSNACTTTDVCTNGTCTGSGNSCGANSSACTNGAPPTCTCNGGFVNSNGQCVPNVNECSPDPCVAGASCNDPSSATGDYVCTCPTGFHGDGKTSGTGCTENDNCVNNPCGAGLGTCVNGVNTHTCNCNMGYVSVNGACECDMNGSFASQISMTTSWPAISGIFAAGTNVPTTQWALRQQTYDSTGQLVIKTTQCGGTTADLCGTLPTLGIDKAYTEFLPATIYGKMGMPVQSLTLSLPISLPNQPYTEPKSAVLLGISLTDPLGTWPASRTNVGAGATGTGGQTNGAVWLDNDGDTFNGVTSYSVPPGGISETDPLHPLENYPATSTQCQTTYDYLENVSAVYSASRTISTLSGTISSCGTNGVTLIQGTVGGPDNGEPMSDARVFGCVTGTGSSQANCSTALINQFDGQGQTQHVTAATFILKRVASNATCDDVRAMTFP